jgi:cytochrome c-type protein NapC
MKKTNSRECRNCHSEEAMDITGQRTVAAEQHKLARQQEKTCIDCHKGIAHQLPEEFLEAEHERFEQENIKCVQCHADMAQAKSGDGWD